MSLEKIALQQMPIDQMPLKMALQQMPIEQMPVKAAIATNANRLKVT